MKKLILLFFILSISFAQHTWIRTYGGSNNDEGYAVQQTLDRGYIVAGKTNSYGSGQADIYLIKTDSLGDTLWTRTYGGSGNDYGYSIQQTPDSGYIVTGQTYSFGAGSGDVWLIKTDDSGDTLWARTYGGPNDDVGGCARMTSDGGYIIAGFTSSFGSGSYDVYLIKTDESGDTLWTGAYGGANFDYSHSVWQTQDGGYITAGGTSSFGAGQSDVYVIKTNAAGDTLWTRTYGGASDDRGNSVGQTQDGSHIIAGVTLSFGADSGDVWFIKTNAAGDTLWNRTYGGPRDEWGNSIQQTTGGDFIIAGWTSSYGAGNYDAYLIKTDSLGDTLWTRTYGGTNIDYGYSVRQTSDGGCIVAGWTSSFGAGGDDVFLIKTDANGNAAVDEEKTNALRSGVKLNVVPNPFISFARIPGHEKENFVLSDITGRRIGNFKGDKIAENLPAGVYFILPQSKNLKPIRIVKIK